MSSNPTSRRQFLKMSAVAISGAALAACGATPTPAPTATPVKVIQTQVVVQTQVVEKVITATPAPVPLTATPVPTPAPKPAVVIKVWHQYSAEPLKQQAMSRVFTEYMSTHPGVVIEPLWWDKVAMWNSFRAAMTAGGKGAPDMIYEETQQCLDWFAAGWLVKVADMWDLKKFAAGVDKDLSFPWVLTYEGNADIILYNPEIFDKIGVKVPADYQFTQLEFVDVVKKARAAGYAGVANAIGNRPYAAQYLVRYALCSLVGIDDFNAYFNGKKNWDTPEVRKAIDWSLECKKAGIWPDNFSTMGIDEFHLYFHTQKKAAMLQIGVWYTGRAFQPVSAGGQDPNFHPGMLKYPKMDGAKAPNMITGGFGGGIGISSASKNVDTCRDILKFWANNPKFGAVWAAFSFQASAIKYTAADIPDDIKTNAELAKWSWWNDSYNKVYSNCEVGLTGAPCGGFNDALTTVINQGLPLGKLDTDTAIKTLNAALCK